MIQKITEIAGKAPSFNINSDEGVSHGSAMFGASLIPGLKMKNVKVNEGIGFNYMLRDNNGKEETLFNKGSYYSTVVPKSFENIDANFTFEIKQPE